MHILDLEKTIVNGVWEGNIGRVNRSTIQVWTGKRFTGIQIVNFYTSGSIDDTKLKVFGDDGKIYITYEEVSKIEEEVEKIKPPLEYTPKETVFIEERLLEQILDRVNELELKDGPPGENGKDLEFNWNGTELGVRVKGDSEYQYVNLKGADGTLDGLTAEQIVTALGYTPANSDNLVEVVDNLETNDATKALSAKQGMELFQSVSNGKSLIAGAITDKGVDTSPSDSFSVMADNIGEIESGVFKLVAGDTPILAIDDTIELGNSEFALIKQAQVNYSGSVRVAFTMEPFNATVLSIRVYINDVPVGLLRESSTNTIQTYVEDFDVLEGDMVQLYAKNNKPNNKGKQTMFQIQILADFATPISV